MTFQTPDWVKHAIFYQIFPDRFSRSGHLGTHKGLTFKPWGSPPEEQGFQGGDLYGIINRLDYLKDLNITALYLNPIFSSASNHRYHPFDYFQVDPLLGGNEALRKLLDEAHWRGIRVVLDGVFNHASRGFWPFHHILENGGNSPYIDWFHIRDWPLRPYSSGKKQPANYDAWWNLPALPKLNIRNEGVRSHILDAARYWLDFGIDGWRLDVPEEIDDEEFWQDFRKVVKSANPEAYICGEIWTIAPEWLRGDRFDALMNYPLGFDAFCFLGGTSLRRGYQPNSQYKLKPVTARTFAGNVESLLATYDWEITTAQLNLFDSHDTARALWVLKEDRRALQLCALFLMTMPGAPCIYYGTEIGMSGANDPHCRGAFPWDDPDRWDRDLLDHYRSITALRHRYPCLRVGKYKTLHARHSVFVFGRELDNVRMIIAFNAGKEEETISFSVAEFTSDGMTFKNVFGTGARSVSVSEGKVELTVKGREGMVLCEG